jgi:hypothetical protein
MSTAWREDGMGRSPRGYSTGEVYLSHHHAGGRYRDEPRTRDSKILPTTPHDNNTQPLSTGASGARGTHTHHITPTSQTRRSTHVQGCVRA